MTSEETQARITEMLAAEAAQPLTWWWLSFADEKFLGCTVVKARGVISATRRAHEIGINPGGSVMSVRLPPDAFPLDVEPPADLHQRLVLTKARADELGAEWQRALHARGRS